MADRFILSQLKRFPMFANLTPEQLEAVANATQIVQYQPGDVVFAQGQPAAGTVIFVSGRGELIQVGTDGVPRQLGAVEAGEYLNEGALFNDVIAPVTLRATEASIALYLSRQQMASLLAAYPDIRAALQNAPAPGRPASQPAPPVVATPFQGLRPNETVLLETRRHWWAFARRIGITILVIILLFVLGSLASRAIPDGPWAALAVPVVLGALGLLGFFYLEWRNDHLLITDQRVVKIRRDIVGLSTSINELPLDSILEVNVVVPVTDVAARIFNYGSITVKASGDGNLMKVDYMPKAKTIQSLIFTHRDRLRQNRAEENRNATREAIRSEIDRFLGRAPQTETPTSTGAQPAITPQGEAGFLSMKFINERGETVYRKHRIVWFQHVLFPGLMILGGVVLFALALLGVTDLGFVGFALAFVVLAVGVVWFFLADWDWRHDMYIIGDQTITLIHQRPLWLQDENDQILLSQVDNVVSEMSGVFDTLFKVGDVKISLMGSDARNAKWFRSVHEPQEIQQEISRRQERARVQRQNAEAERQKQAILDYLSVYHETVGGGAQTGSASSAGEDASAEQPPQVRDRTRPPGIPLVRRDNPPNS